jgi:hypothetical protein
MLRKVSFIGSKKSKHATRGELSRFGMQLPSRDKWARWFLRTGRLLVTTSSLIIGGLMTYIVISGKNTEFVINPLWLSVFIVITGCFVLYILVLIGIRDHQPCDKEYIEKFLLL